jgi:hypothetical protein
VKGIRFTGISVLVLLLGFQSFIPAQTREEATLWGVVENSTRPDDYRAYLDAYPNGTFAPLARRRLASLLEAARGATEATRAAAALALEAKHLPGSTWEGTGYWRMPGLSTRVRPAQPTDPKADKTATQFSFGANGVCTRDEVPSEKQPCTWTSDGDKVTVTVGKGCKGTYSLEFGETGTELSGLQTLGGSWGCVNGQETVVLTRKKTAK